MRHTAAARQGLLKVRVNGQTLPLAVALITHRCADCFGPLRRRNAGLVCAADDDHRFFIRQAEVAEIEQRQAQAEAQAREEFEIVDGVITPRKDPIDAIARP